METTLDNLIFYVENVTAFQFDNFILELEKAETFGKVPRIRREIGIGFSKYHHNIRIGEGGGAIHIGFKHNSVRENQNSYRMRFEVNPSKQISEQHEKARQCAADIFVESFSGNTKLIKGVDVAFDIPIAKEKLFVVSKTGRERNILKGTSYFGERGQNGHLKVYDKKKELEKKQRIQIEEEHLTRIEFGLRMAEPVTFHLFSKAGTIGINELYQVSVLESDKAEGVIKACIIAVSSGEMQMGELSRTYQLKTKKALADMRLLDLDDAYANAQRDIVNKIRQFLTTSNNSISKAV